MSEDTTSALIRQVQWADDAVVAEVVGEITLAQSGQFQEELDPILAKKPAKLVLDLAGVGYMDSSGIASLVKVLHRVRSAGAAMRLAGMSQRVRSLFEITRLDGVFEIDATTEDALNA